MSGGMARAPLDREIAAHSALQKEAPSAKSMTDEAPRKHYLYYNNYNYIFIPNLKRLTAKNVEVVTPVRLKRTTFRTGI